MNEWFSNGPNLIIPGIGILLPLGIIAVVSHFKNKEREMIHRERMAALEKGLQPPVEPEPSSGSRRQHGPRNYLLRGLVWLFVGLGVLAPMFVYRGLFPMHMDQELVLFPFLGFVPAGIGVAYLIFYAIEGNKPHPPAP